MSCLSWSRGGEGDCRILAHGRVEGKILSGIVLLLFESIGVFGPLPPQILAHGEAEGNSRNLCFFYSSLYLAGCSYACHPPRAVDVKLIVGYWLTVG